MVKIYIDGSSVGNPGNSGIGYLIYEQDSVIKKESVYLGIQTNNFAEYMALIFSLQEALIRRANIVEIYTDSQLLCRQINNEYKIKSPNLIGLYSQVRNLLPAFDCAQVKYISREKNREADKLARRATKPR